MPGKIVAIYAIVAGIWILASDEVLDRLPLGPGGYRFANSSKGLFFVSATAVLLYVLLMRWSRRVDQGHQERLRAESAFRAVVEAAPDAIFIEADGRYVFVNSGLHQLLGVPEQDSLLGREFGADFGDAMRSQMIARTEGFRHDGRPVGPIEGTVKRSDGKPVQVEVKAVPIDHQGRRAALVFARDVSLRVEAESERRRQHELLQAVLRSTADAIFVKDLGCRYLLINDSGARILGRPIEEILGQRHDEFLPKPMAAALEASDRQVLQSGRRCEFDLPMVVNGQRRHYFLTKEPLLDPAGRLTGLLGVARDRTEQVAAEESLRRLSGMFLRLQDEERRGIARELHDTTAQALVAVSLGLSEAIRSAEEGDGGVVEALEECRKLVEGCTRDVRTLSYGLHPPMLDEMGLHAALEEYVKELAKRSGLRLEFVCASELGRLSQEAETALFRVAQEALLNIHRHSGSPDGKVELRDNAGGIELEVRDSGRGIPEERLRQLRVGTAVGVGVSGMQERLRQLGGELDIRSDGSGTVVLARLPLGRGGGDGSGGTPGGSQARWV